MKYGMVSLVFSASIGLNLFELNQILGLVISSTGDIGSPSGEWAEFRYWGSSDIGNERQTNKSNQTKPNAESMALSEACDLITSNSASFAHEDKFIPTPDLFARRASYISDLLLALRALAS